MALDVLEEVCAERLLISTHFLHSDNRSDRPGGRYQSRTVVQAGNYRPSVHCLRTCNLDD